MKKPNTQPPHGFPDPSPYSDPQLRLQEISFSTQQVGEMPIPLAAATLGMAQPGDEASADLDVEKLGLGATPCSIH